MDKLKFGKTSILTFVIFPFQQPLLKFVKWLMMMTLHISSLVEVDTIHVSKVNSAQRWDCDRNEDENDRWLSVGVFITLQTDNDSYCQVLETKRITQTSTTGN